MSYNIDNERSWIEIDLSNFEENLTRIKAFFDASQKFLQIIKADAYGHGALQIAKIAIKNGAEMLGVANADEAQLIRYHNIESPILILSPALDSEIDSIVNHNLIPTINDLSFAVKLNNLAQEKNKTIKVHINIDTGMNRSGIKVETAPVFIYEILKLKNILIDGFFTHFAESESNNEFTEHQYHVFTNCIQDLLAKFPALKPSYLHCSNSCAVINFNFPAMNLVRLGILSFGIYPTDELISKIQLKPVMKFLTKISQIKSAKKNEYIGYNLTYKVEKDLNYAILPIGYADGYNYLLSNKGIVKLDEHSLPLLGKVTMDMIIVDISKVNDSYIGQQVLLFGDHDLRIENLAKLYSGSPYELATQTGKRAKRFYFYQNNLLAQEPRLRREFYSPDFSEKKLTSIIKNALDSRITSSEVSQVLFSEIINDFIKQSDDNISYRTNFNHKITFSLNDNYPNFYIVNTELSYTKTLNRHNFLIACASNPQTLDAYFKDPQVEYRWLLRSELALSDDSFSIEEVSINSIPAQISKNDKAAVLEFRCSNKDYQALLGQKCSFSIKTKTLYPINSHQLSIFISEPTKGVTITFEYPKSITEVDTVTLFSGQTKYPKITENKGIIHIETDAQSWILPNSGVIFSF